MCTAAHIGLLIVCSSCVSPPSCVLAHGCKLHVCERLSKQALQAGAVGKTCKLFLAANLFPHILLVGCECDGARSSAVFGRRFSACTVAFCESSSTRLSS